LILITPDRAKIPDFINKNPKWKNKIDKKPETEKISQYS